MMSEVQSKLQLLYQTTIMNLSGKIGTGRIVGLLFESGLVKS